MQNMVLLDLKMNRDQANLKHMEKHLEIGCYPNWIVNHLRAWPDGIVQLWQSNWGQALMRFGEYSRKKGFIYIERVAGASALILSLQRNRQILSGYI